MVWVTTEVDVDMECFDDDDIIEEYNNRNLGGVDRVGDDEIAELHQAYALEWQGKRAEAFEILWRHCLIKLNKVV